MCKRIFVLMALLSAGLAYADAPGMNGSFFTELYRRQQEARPTKVCVYWVSKNTGASGKGEPVNRVDAEAFASYANKKYVDLYHEVKPCK